MDNTRAVSHNTKLVDRTLWYDGQSSFNADDLLVLKSQYKVQFVDELNDKVREYNKHVQRNREIKPKTSCDDFSVDWTIPPAFRKLDVETYLISAHEVLLQDTCTPEEFDRRERRLCQEIVKFKALELFDVLRTVIWIINKLTANNIVWGVGRGSSVSSYVLYVIGVHDVDSFAYGLNIDDFLHE